MTATDSATTTVPVEIIETATVIQTDVISLTATVTATETATYAPEPPQASCLTNTDAFRAMGTYNGGDLYLYANVINGLSGGANWMAGSTSTSPSVQNKFNLAVDSEGHLYLHDSIPPYTGYIFYFYTTTGSARSDWPQLAHKQNLDTVIANGGKYSKLKACVNSVTGELTVEDSMGRKNMLWCGQQLWLSATLGEDINRGVCSQMFPKAVAPYKA